MPDRKRSTMTYAEKRHGDRGRYVVIDADGSRTPFDSKIDAISEAQRRNGYLPVDGSEATYGRQIRNN